MKKYFLILVLLLIAGPVNDLSLLDRYSQHEMWSFGSNFGWGGGSGGGGGTPSGDALLLENNDYILLENNDFLLLE